MPVHKIDIPECSQKPKQNLVKALESGLLESSKKTVVNKLLNSKLNSPSKSSSSVSLDSLASVASHDNIIIEEKRNEHDKAYSNENNAAFNLFNESLSQPLTTSILKPGSTFKGFQQSGRSTYEVAIDLKYVDLSKSYLNGFLKIKGLTESFPQIITYFEAEIISDIYPFLASRNPANSTRFNTNDDIDLQHWSRFPFWKNKSQLRGSVATPSSHLSTSHHFKKIISAPEYVHENYLKKKYIYMRWKEKFLVPDARVDSIEGASFAGFYYICFNQVSGDIVGLYYHKNSERFQQLELNYVEDRGIRPSYQLM